MQLPYFGIADRFHFQENRFLRAAAGILAAVFAFVLSCTPASATTAGNYRSPHAALPAGSPRNTAGPHAYAGGGLLAFGSAQVLGSNALSARQLSSPMTSMASTPDGKGYWLVGADGDVFSYGDAVSYGSFASKAIRPYAPVISIVATTDGKGYWLLGQDGGIFTFGDAGYFGSTGNLKLVQPVVGMARTQDSRGYWLVAADGGIFSYGDARYYGSTAASDLPMAVSGMASTVDGKGYWLTSQDGGVFTFGDAGFYGSASNENAQMGNWNAIVVNIARTSDGKGYWLADSSGAIYPFGDAKNLGSENGQLPSTPVADIVATGSGFGYWLLQPAGWNYNFTNPIAASPIPQAREIVNVAASQVRANPNANGQFCNPYGPCEAWCSIFSTWIWQQAGIPVPTFPFTGDVYTWAAQNGEVLAPTDLPAPSDVVMYGYSPDQGESLHTGTVVQVWPNGSIETIEGDTGPDIDGWYSVSLNGPFLPGDPWAYYDFPVYAYAQPTP